MNSIFLKPSCKEVCLSKDRRQLKIAFSLVVLLKALQVSQCFVPRAFGTKTCMPRATTLRIQQELTQIDALKNNEGHQIGIGQSLANSNNTKCMGTLQARKSKSEDANEFYPIEPLNFSKKDIESTVDDMLKPSLTSMGLFGQMVDENSVTKRVSILATSSKSSSSIVARVATVMDDLQIANLRLSVFSNFNPDSRKLFCERSCQLLSSRRRRGATCIVATMKEDLIDDMKPRTKTRAISFKGDEAIVGTAEISFHEFSGTEIGRYRPKGSILYVTEVAVDVSQRRKGIAKLMMEAIDTVANNRKVETIYLHVDVNNMGAVNLYQRAGYKKLKYENPMFLEFTTKLNLHDGATKGRNHHLMAKDLRQPTWFTFEEESRHEVEACTGNSQERTLGFNVISAV